jgi:hypothetical protein
VSVTSTSGSSWQEDGTSETGNDSVIQVILVDCSSKMEYESKMARRKVTLERISERERDRLPVRLGSRTAHRRLEMIERGQKLV